MSSYETTSSGRHHSLSFEVAGKQMTFETGKIGRQAGGSVVARTDVGEEEGWVLRPGLSVTTSATTLEQLYTSHQPLLLCLGYAGWGAGQLDQEIEIGSWLFADASDELIFDTPREALYDSALASLGLTPGTIIMNPVEA